MSDPFIGEIRMFAGNFAPRGWSFCEGQVLPISQNEALFSLLGTTYGGDGQTTFALPDLRGRLPVHQGQGSGLSVRVLGQAYGSETVTLTQTQMPSHSHALMASANAATASSPAGELFAAQPGDLPYLSNPSTPPVPLRADSVLPAGGNQPHDNLMPYLCLNFIISQFGIFPSQS